MSINNNNFDPHLEYIEGLPGFQDADLTPSERKGRHNKETFLSEEIPVRIGRHATGVAKFDFGRVPSGREPQHRASDGAATFSITQPEK